MRRNQHDLLFYEVDILSQLFGSDEGVSCKVLAEDTNDPAAAVANGTIYRRLHILEKKGLVERGEAVNNPNQRGRPSTPYHITALGVLGVSEFANIDVPLDLFPVLQRGEPIVITENVALGYN